jgi:hypothetical protein
MMDVFLAKITQISQINSDYLQSPLRLRVSALIYRRHDG